jgi:hypothetical protein
MDPDLVDSGVPEAHPAEAHPRVLHHGGRGIILTLQHGNKAAILTYLLFRNIICYIRRSKCELLFVKSRGKVTKICLFFSLREV